MRTTQSDVRDDVRAARGGRHAEQAPPQQAPRRHLPKRSRPAVPRPRTRPQIESGSETQDEPQSSMRAPFVVLIIVLVGVGMVGLVLLNTAVNQNAFRLHELSKEQKQLDVAEQQLGRDVAEMETAGALSAAANRLGLVPAGPPAFIKLPSGEVVGKPTPAK